MNPSDAMHPDPVLESPLALRTRRMVLAAAGILAWFATQSALASRGFPHGIGDGLHVAFAPATDWLTHHPWEADLVLILTTAVIDALGCFLILSGILGSSIRPLLGLMVLFSFRQVCQSLTALPAPEGMIWRDPGFPSLFVTYATGNDFFFSGHTAIAVYAAMELAGFRKLWLTSTAAVLAAIEALTVLVLRAHYTMDVFTAILAAASARTIADRLSPAIDTSLGRSWPFKFRRIANYD